MIGQTEMWTALNVAGITSLLTSYSGTPGLIQDSRIPDKINGVVTKAQDTTINYYPSGPFFGALDYGQYPFTINCRAKNFQLSRQLAETVFDEINRSGGGYFIICDLLQTIEPQDETDNYNTPLAVTLKTRG